MSGHIPVVEYGEIQALPFKTALSTLPEFSP